MTCVFSWQNSISLCPASFCTAMPNTPVTPGVSCLPTFAFQFPIMKRTSFWVLVLEGFKNDMRVPKHIFIVHPTRPFRNNTQKDVLFIIGDWNAKGGSQETPGVTGKFGLGIRNEAGQRLIEFCQENALVIANTLFQ